MIRTKAEYLKTAAFALALTVLSLPALAAPSITGGLGLGGAFKAWTGPNVTGSETNNLDNAMSIETLDSTFDANQVEGDFTDVPIGTNVNFYADFNRDGSGIPVILWSITGNTTTFDFELQTFVVDEAASDPNTLVLSGTGVFKAAGFADTAAVWDATLNTTTQGQFTVRTMSDSTAAVVPVPATLGLIGFGLFGLGMIARYKKSRPV